MKKLIVVGILSLCWFAAGACGTNLFVNGDFTGGEYQDTAANAPPPLSLAAVGWGPAAPQDFLPNSWYLSPPADPAQSNVNVFADTVAGVTDPVCNCSSGYYVAFASASEVTPVNDGQDCLYQEIPTVVGHEYTISFWVAITAAATSNTDLNIEWDAEGANDHSYVDPYFWFPNNAGPELTFEQFTFPNLTASLSTTRFYFHGTDGNGAILVTDAVMTDQSAVPEPTSALLVSSGLMLVALAARQIRRKRDNRNAKALSG